MFTHDKEDMKIIKKIVNRAIALGDSRDKMSITMDLSAANFSNPLRLHDLLEADDFNFCHDVFGIALHLNRETGKLENHFSPRFSKRLGNNEVAA